MKVLSRVLPPVAACLQPFYRRRAPPRPPIVIETTRTPTACGQVMDAGNVQQETTSFAGAPEPPARFLKRLPRTHEAHTCVVNNFVWKDPTHATPSEIQDFYANRIAMPGAFGGYLEAEALGNLLQIRIGVWDRYDDRFLRWLTTQGVDDPKAPTVHILNLSGIHWVALIPPCSSGAPWIQRDAGGGGDCLFRAVAAAIAVHPDLCGMLSSKELRQRCAAKLARDPAYQERIVSLAQEAWSEHRATALWRRLWLRFN